MATADKTAMLILDCATDGHILFISRAAAKDLHKRNLLQKIDGKAAYCAPRSWRQIAHDITPPLHRDVLDHAHLKPKDATNA